MLSALRVTFDAIARDPALADEHGFAARVAALDALEYDLLDPLAGLDPAQHDADALARLRQDAEDLADRLAAANQRQIDRVRADIRRGACRGAALRAILDAVSEDAGAGYDSLDLFLNSLLGITAVPAETAGREPEMVPYQKTPARVALRLVALAGVTERDVFFDIGAGLGHVPILVHLLTGARAIGVEREPAFCVAARSSVAALGLEAVTFVQADARAAAYAEGSVFFLYTPFRGKLLQDVLDRLRRATSGYAIRLGAFGPCATEVAGNSWLSLMHTYKDSAGQLAIFGSATIAGSAEMNRPVAGS